VFLTPFCQQSEAAIRIWEHQIMRIGNINALRRRAPLSWLRPRDITSQTRTRNAAGADATAYLQSELSVAKGALSDFVR